MIAIQDHAIIGSLENEFLRIEPYGPNAIRVRASMGKISDENWTLLSPEASDCKIVTQEDGSLRMKNGRIELVITADSRISFWNSEGQLLTEEYWMDERDQPARLMRGHVGGASSIELRLKPQKNEHFYGLGQDGLDVFDRKGGAFDLYHQNTKSSIPFVVSSRGYGFIWNNPAIGRAELTTVMTRWVAQVSRQMDYVVISGPTPSDIMKDYCRITGFAPEFPYWATGFWQSKCRYETQEELMTVARRYRDLGIPLSMIVCDFFHWTAQGEWKFDLEAWPDPAGMVKELKEMGTRLLVSIWPTVDPRSENYEYMKEHNLLIRAERGPGALTYCWGPETYFDATNPEARAFLWEKVKKNYYDYGIRNFWLDEAEPEILPYDYDNLRYYEGNGMEVSCLYPFLYAKGFYEGLRSTGEEEVFNLIRCAYIGSQRYGVTLWSGDVAATFAALRRQIKTALNVAMSGIPWWSTDIGGFRGGDPDSESYRECIIRWFQFGAFCPVFRLHGNRFRPNKPKIPHFYTDPFCPSGGPNEIWSYGDTAYQIFTAYIQIREYLRDYIKENLDLASTEGIPLMRPLFFHYPEEINYEISDEYMFGSDILVCPVCEAGASSREVYLPKGTSWVEVQTGREYEGGSYVTADAPLSCIPLFLRADSTLDREKLRCGLNL